MRKNILKTQFDFLKAFTPAVFLYVIYIVILGAIPMGILTAFYPIFASDICLGAKNWLDAIPHNLWELFAAGYLGYSFTTYKSVKK